MTLGEQYIDLRPTATGKIHLHFKENGKHIGYAYMEVDGDYVYVPDKNDGAWPWYILIALGEALKKLNDEYGINPE